MLLILGSVSTKTPSLQSVAAISSRVTNWPLRVASRMSNSMGCFSKRTGEFPSSSWYPSRSRRNWWVRGEVRGSMRHPGV